MFKKLAIYSLTAALFGAGSVAVAHTGVKDKGLEGQGLYTAFTIGHGCESATNTALPILPVIAQSVVFPNGIGSVAFKIDPATKAESRIDLSKFITGAIGGVVTLGPKAAQDKSIFQVAKSVVDAAGNVRGLKFTNGQLDPTMVGLVPFKVSGIKFEPTSCANSLQVRVAIANWCNTSQDVADDRRVDLWMGHTTTKFNDPNVLGTSGGNPYWPTLTINRDLVANPLPAACGAGFAVAVQPHDSNIDAQMPIKGYWPMP